MCQVCQVRRDFVRELSFSPHMPVRDEKDNRRSKGSDRLWEIPDVFGERLGDDAVGATCLRVVCGDEPEGKRACPGGGGSGSRLGGTEDLPDRAAGRRGPGLGRGPRQGAVAPVRPSR